jgi:DNA-binding response OmpR family regulator
MVCDGLKHYGYSVQVVSDAEADLTVAAAHAPDLVVLDLMLPGLDGLSVYRQPRASGGSPTQAHRRGALPSIGL